MKISTNAIAAICTLCLCAGCVVGPAYQKPQPVYGPVWHGADAGAGTGEGTDAPAITAPAPVTAGWEALFDDALLLETVKNAVAGNKTVAAERARVKRAAAETREAGGALLPSADASAGASRSDGGEGSKPRNAFSAALGILWQPDIFGANKRELEAARAREEAAREALRAAELEVSAEAARLYAEIRGLQQRIAVTKKNNALFKRTLKLINAREEAGESTRFDVKRAESEYKLNRSRLPDLEAALQENIYTLSALSGQAPEALTPVLSSPRPLPETPEIAAIGLRTDIISRRPDIAEAERELAASVADIGAREAERYPVFPLSASLGTSADSLGDLFNASSLLWSLAAAANAPLFEGGAIQARIDAAKADSEEQRAVYEQLVLTALAEAESALARYTGALQTRARLRESVAGLREAARLAGELFSAGEEDYLAVLDAERRLVSAENELVSAEIRAVTGLIALYAALGAAG